MSGYNSKRQMAQDKVAEMLDLCDYLEGNDASLEAQCKAAAFIREALAQPAQEPFGWYSAQEDEFMTDKLRKEHERLNSYTHIHGKFNLPLYTAPQQRPWVGLTDEELTLCESEEDVRFVRAIEAVLRSKNT